MHKNELRPIGVQVGVAVAMIFFGVTVLQNIFMSGIVCVFAALLLKDAYEMYKAEYHITKTSLQYIVGEKVKWEILWTDLDMVTRTKKNHKWVVVSNGTEFKMLKNTISDFEELIRNVVIHGATNKDMKLHETIVEYVNLDLNLDDLGRIKSKSRTKLLELQDTDDK